MEQPSQHDWNSSGSWTTGTPTTATEALAGVVEEYSADVDLETAGYVSCMVEVQASFVAGADQNLVISVYPSLDGTYDGEEIAIFSSEVEWVAADIKFFSFFVPDVPHFRLGFVHAATTTDVVTVNAVHYQAWNYQSS